MRGDHVDMLQAVAGELVPVALFLFTGVFTAFFFRNGLPCLRYALFPR